MSGSLNCVVAGSHCTKYVHKVLSEPLERILLTRFLAEKRQELPIELQEVASDPLFYSETAVHNSEEFFRSYTDCFQSTLNRNNSKTSAILG